MNNKVIGVMGATGTGKTTFINQFSESCKGYPIYEEWKNNPYMSDFYSSKSLYENQIWFIENDVDRMLRATNIDGIVIVDKLFLQNYTFTSITNFSDIERHNCFAILDKYKYLAEHVDIIINISINESEILKRIKIRNREQELSLNIKWFEEFQKTQEYYLSLFQKEFKFKLVEYDNINMGYIDIKNKINSFLNE